MATQQWAFGVGVWDITRWLTMRFNDVHHGYGIVFSNNPEPNFPTIIASGQSCSSNLNHKNKQSFLENNTQHPHYRKKTTTDSLLFQWICIGYTHFTNDLRFDSVYSALISHGRAILQVWLRIGWSEYTSFFFLFVSVFASSKLAHGVVNE